MSLSGGTTKTVSLLGVEMRKNYGMLYTLPVTLWITLFFVVPLLIIFSYSFMEKGLYGGVVFGHFSLDAYRALANPAFLKVTLATLWITTLTTVITVACALPAAYFIARSNYKNFFLLLVIVPFWTDFMVRIYAWINILGNSGLVNNLLMNLGIIKEHLPLLYKQHSVILVMVYTYLPFAILPLYATIEKFDFSLIEAARDLGASKFQAMHKVLIPNIKGGVVTAVLFTFIPAFGNYAVPLIVGGHDSTMLGNLIARELTITRNWPLASSISVVITCVTTLSVVLVLRLNAAQAKAKQVKSIAEEMPA